jgi:Ca-activated chloride channel family protein
MTCAWPALGGAVCAGVVFAHAAQAPAPQFRGTGNAVAVYATVTDAKNAAVSGLTRDDFTVLDDGRPREITVFAATEQPITATLLLDMNGPSSDLPWLRDAAMGLVDALRPADRLRIGTFGSEVALSPLLTGNTVELRRVLFEELWPAWTSPLWNAIDEALAAFPPDTRRRAVIVLTNGTDQPPQQQKRGRNGRNVAEHAEDLGAVVHVVTFTEASLDGGLRVIAERTGGRFERIDDLSFAAPVLEAVAGELRAEYLLGFVPAVLDGRMHELEVRTTRPGLRVRARERYLAAGSR